MNIRFSNLLSREFCPFAAFLMGGAFVASLSASAAETNELSPKLQQLEEKLNQTEAELSRQINELMWFQRLGDIATVDKVRFTGPSPRAKIAEAVNEESNHVIVAALTFMPRERTRAAKLPLVVLAHGEIHGNVASDEELHIVREMLQQGYAVIAPDYRGSSGYGSDFWHKIDYGGREIEDVHAARQFMLDRFKEIDPHRVGIVGWSHGGLISLMTVFAHPKDYQACYAGMPVSDLEERINIRGTDYEQLFAAPYHIGKTFTEAPQEYHRRSPARNVDKLQTPLLLDANTNDEDVTVREVQKLLEALKASRKSFEYHIYTNAPGGHYFNRLDMSAAIESRAGIWRFLARYLHPPHRK